ncbi:MAG: cupin domain-containing protein [Deltaproteobacteria bacterium]|nr:cupin domain-containing protein [Deltaproteobacteria bacterium]
MAESTPDQPLKQGWNPSSPEASGQALSREQVFKHEDVIEWRPHPMNHRLKMGFLITKEKDGVELTCIRGMIPRGESVPEHTHSVHDILYPISGKGKIWVAGIGESEIRKGVLVHVPPGVGHRIYDVTEDLELFDVFSGPLL